MHEDRKLTQKDKVNESNQKQQLPFKLPNWKIIIVSEDSNSECHIELIDIILGLPGDMLVRYVTDQWLICVVPGDCWITRYLAPRCRKSIITFMSR